MSAIATIVGLTRGRPIGCVAMAVSLAYLALYLYAIGDLGFVAPDGAHWRFAGNPFELMFRHRSGFNFEAIGLLQLGFVQLLVAPINLLAGTLLSVLVGLNVVVGWLALRIPRICGARTATSALGMLPALLSGAGCCAPTLFIALGAQLSATAISLFGVLVPVALLLLVMTLVVNGRRIVDVAGSVYSENGEGSARA